MSEDNNLVSDDEAEFNEMILEDRNIEEDFEHCKEIILIPVNYLGKKAVPRKKNYFVLEDRSSFNARCGD